MGTCNLRGQGLKATATSLLFPTMMSKIIVTPAAVGTRSLKISSDEIRLAVISHLPRNRNLNAVTAVPAMLKNEI